MNQKPQYILDECVSIELSFSKHIRFIESRDVLGKSASDDMILDYAKKHELIIVTRDYYFAEKILDEGYPVLLLLFRNKWGIVKPDKNVNTLERILFDEYTYYLKKRNEIIIP